MLHFMFLLALGVRVLVFVAERNYQKVGLTVLSIGVERYWKVSEHTSPAEIIPPRNIPDCKFIWNGPPIVDKIILVQPSPSRPFNLEPLCHNCTFSHSCPGRRPIEPETKELVLYHHAHASGHKTAEPALLFWFGALIISTCIAGSGIFWDKSHSIFARFRNLALTRRLNGYKCLDDEQETEDEEPKACQICANHAVVSDELPLKWINKYTWLQKEYNDMKAKKRELQVRLRSKSCRADELARRNILFRRKVFFQLDAMQILGEKLRDLDKCVEEMRQYYKLAVVFKYVEDEESARNWQQHLNRFRDKAHLPSLHGLIQKDALQLGKPYVRRLKRKKLPPRQPPRPPNQHGMFP